MRTSLIVLVLLSLFVAACASTAPKAHVRIDPFTPPSPDHSTLLELLPDGHTPGQPVDVADIRIVPVLNPSAPASTDYLTLHETLLGGKCVVAEKDGVNALAITNTADQPIFLMVGDLVLGGKQDRIMAESIVVEAGAKGESIPVFCVEHGRWSPEDGKEVFYAGAKAQQADVAVKSAAIATKNQGSVWDAVARNNEALGVSGNTRTGTFRATFDDAETIARLERMFETAAGAKHNHAVGYAVVYADEVVAMDLFDSRGLCAKLSDKLLRSYLVTAMSGGYAPGPKHPLRERLSDRVTLQAQDVPLSQLVRQINAEWSLVVHLNGDRDPNVTLDLRETSMQEALVRLAVSAEVRVMVGRGSVTVETDDIRAPRDDEFVAENPDSGIFFNHQDPNNPPVNFNQDIGSGFERIEDHGGTGNDAGFFFQDTPPSGNVRIDQRARIEELFDESLGGSRSGGPSNLGGADFGGNGGPAQVPVQTEETVNESTETERSYNGEGVKYESRDTKRNSTVHRSFMRR